MKILLTGGGTLGPAVPLLAVAEELKKINTLAELVWIGTENGPEIELVQKYKIRFVPSDAPKFDRYFSKKIFMVPFRMIQSFKSAYKFVKIEKPDLVMTAGGYVSVPFVWSAQILGIKTWVHQQDVRVGLANKFMARFATKITTAWQTTQKNFFSKRSVCIGNPIRPSIFFGSKKVCLEKYNLDATKPTIAVLGGGGGAQWINETMAQISGRVAEIANVIHLTGRGKNIFIGRAGVPENYRALELAIDMADIFAAADLVVARAGMGTISELAALKKASIIIPIPNSHQEDNTIEIANCAASVVLSQNTCSAEGLLSIINDLINDKALLDDLGAKLNSILKTEGVANRIAREAINLIAKTAA